MVQSTGLAGSSLASTVQSGPLVVALGVSLLVGVVGFASPCVLPLVPGYLSYVTGLTGENEGKRQQGRMLAGSLLFVFGFSAIFVAGGALFGELGSSIAAHLVLLERIFGAITIGLGLVFLGAFSFMQREFKVHHLPRAGLAGAPLLGATFGLAWTPCFTPTYTAVATLAFSQATAARGALLLAAYCIGLGIPFVLVALGIGWMGGAVSFLRRHGQAVSRLGGALLVVLGVLLVTGQWDVWMRGLQTSVATVGVSI